MGTGHPHERRSAASPLARVVLLATLGLAVGCADAVPPAELPTPSPGRSPLSRRGPDAVAAASSSADPGSGAAGQGESIATAPNRVTITSPRPEFIPVIHFPSLSIALGDNDLAVVEEVRKLLVEHPEVLKVRVTGHADSTEPDGQALGAKRAEVVVRLLVQGGIAAGRLEAASAGSAMPVESNDTLGGRAGNRRITFLVLEKD